MKIVITRQDLFDAVSKVKNIVSSRATLPILSNVLLTAEDSLLKVSTTDLKVSIECQVDCTVEEPGSCMVSSQLLTSLLSEFPSGDISISLDGSNVYFRCGRIKTRLLGADPQEFPPLRDFKGIEPIVLKQGVLKPLLGKVSFAIASEDGRPVLTGLLLEISEDELAAVATDGRRLSLIREKIRKDENNTISVTREVKAIIPRKVVNELEKQLKDSEDEVKIYPDENQFGFAFGNTLIVAQVIEGNFPKYQSIIPEKHDKEIILNTAIFREAIRRTSTMTNDKFNSVRFSVKEGEMMLHVNTPDVGEYQEAIPVEYEGEPVDIAFNPDYIKSVLNLIGTEKTALILKDDASPGVIKAVEKTEDDGEKILDNYINVIMPIRL